MNRYAKPAKRIEWPINPAMQNRIIVDLQDRVAVLEKFVFAIAPHLDGMLENFDAATKQMFAEYMEQEVKK